MKKMLSAVFGLCLIWIVLVFSIQSWALNPDFYVRQYEQMHLDTQLYVSDKDLKKCIVTLLDYLEDQRDDIVVVIKKDQIKQNAFNQRETDHMVDVKNLYRRVIFSAKAAGVILLGILIYIGRKKNGMAFLTKGVLEASFSFLVFVLFLAGWMMIDFTDFWTRFHHVFFSNDLWLLTPGVDFMIDILPESVFFNLVIRIVVTCVVTLGLFNAICFYYQKKKAPIGYEREL